MTESDNQPKNQPEKRSFFDEFREFISRGSVIDLAVGVVVGGAFTSIVNSLVNDIITPLLGLIMGGIDFSSLSFTFKSATVAYGSFIQNIINFFIIAFCIFIVIRAINRMHDRADLKKAELEKKAAELKAKLAKKKN